MLFVPRDCAPYLRVCRHTWVLKNSNFQTLITPAPSPSPSPRDHLRLNYLLKENMSVSLSLDRSTCLSRALFHRPPGRPTIPDHSSLSLYWFAATVINTHSHKDTLGTVVSAGTRGFLAIKLARVCGVLIDWFIHSFEADGWSCVCVCVHLEWMFFVYPRRRKILSEDRRRFTSQDRLILLTILLLRLTA